MTCVRSKVVILVTVLVLLSPTKALEWDDVWCKVKEYGTAGVVGVSVVAAAPVVVGAMGFTGGGIAAGTLAAKMMSTAAVANGGSVVAGGVVATLQSVGAAGMGLSAKAGVVSTVGAAYHYVFGGKCDKENCE